MSPIKFAIVMIIAMAACTSPQKSRLENLKAKHPYALLGDDYGILNEKNLECNDLVAEPQPFSPDSISYPYWQCFETKLVSFFCDHSGIKPPEKPKEALIVLVVSGLEIGQEYLARRPIDLKDCRSSKKEWGRLTNNEKYVCISGPFIHPGLNDRGEKINYWVFDKYKTSKGMDLSFADNCDHL